MIKIENTEVYGWEAAIRGMRNPMNSWDKSDSVYGCDLGKCGSCFGNDELDCKEKTYHVGQNDLLLMKKLINAGSDHRKFMRYITVTADITAPLYWWKEYDTYKVGTVANSCSTMHKISEKEFTWEDFSTEHLRRVRDSKLGHTGPTLVMDSVICALNEFRLDYLKSKSKEDWWQMIQLLPTSYNQRRSVLLNYEVLLNMYHSRNAHKLDEWRIGFCDWVRSLPYSELITGEDGSDE